MISRKIRICVDCIHYEYSNDMGSLCKRIPIIDLISGNKTYNNAVSQRHGGNCGTAGQYFEPIESKVREYQWDSTLENNPF